MAHSTKFTLNFIEGAGEVDGEILETLWSPLDEVSWLTQAMSIAHRQEVLDAYMNDSNWRKIVQMVDSLCGKWTRAKQGVSNTKPAFKQLTNCVDPSLVLEWTRQERVAMENRGDDLKIYDVVSEKLPTLAEIHLKLAEKEVQQGNLSEQILDVGPESEEVLEDILELHPDVMEAELRKAQVTDALKGLRLALGEKSPCFRMEVRNADTQRTTN
ncbi:hypothetical protein PILCRDRAFT_15550 [Piloderma croceum F 1598]|uniref:Uncharacterized protein n=1 Tax=Piloderma croceum (strain F 1598) TaxID=765440 RepID=A0A0C3EKC2_PILCF|nr:hypothetical protein PILCRDRAFT_15550 [Piloderma croceum F 1598]